MNYYLAPMEGLTTYQFRIAYHHYFGGIDKYFTPFISSKKMNHRERSEILPKHNEGLHVIPQILTNRSDEFLQIADKIKDYGYSTVNLNLGCPSGTVVARKRGAGFLSIPDSLDRFLYELYEKCPLNISIKTRIGIESLDEWENLLKIYQKYPVEELIIHPRLQKELYHFTPHIEAFQTALHSSTMPLCYNGDLTSVTTFNTLVTKFPQINRVMIGRGIIKNPALIFAMRDLKEKHLYQNFYQKERFRAFHDTLFDSYATTMSGETPTLFKMKDLWTYLSQSFIDSSPYLKKIRKATSFAQYKIAIDTLFRECELMPTP